MAMTVVMIYGHGDDGSYHCGDDNVCGESYDDDGSNDGVFF